MVGHNGTVPDGVCGERSTPPPFQFANDGVLSAFDHVRPAGDGWSARCPAHDDRRSSLAIGRGDDGRWLLHCHAGCPLVAILEAAHLTTRDLFPKTKSEASIVATYPYHDEGGGHLYDVVRFAPKKFRQRRADGAWTMDGVRRVLYRLPDLPNAATVYVTEGKRTRNACA